MAAIIEKHEFDQFINISWYQSQTQQIIKNAHNSFLTQLLIVDIHVSPKRYCFIVFHRFGIHPHTCSSVSHLSHLLFFGTSSPRARCQDDVSSNKLTQTSLPPTYHASNKNPSFLFHPPAQAHTSKSGKQSVSQSTNQVIGRSVGQSIKHSINQPLMHSFIKAIAQSVNQSCNQPDRQAVGRSVSQPVSQSVNHPLNQTNIHSINKSFNHYIAHSFVRPIIHSFGQSIFLSTHPSM